MDLQQVAQAVRCVATMTMSQAVVGILSQRF